MRPSFDLSLYLIVGRSAAGTHGLVDIVLRAVEGGVTMVQIRDPRADARDLIADTIALKKVLAPRGIALIVNDRVDVALAAGADGVHLGQDDMTAADARGIAGPDFLIWLSVGNPKEFERSNLDLPFVDYLGVGPVHATSTKPNAGDAIGMNGFSAVRALTDLPVVAIGGLGEGRSGAVITAGAQGVAVISAICSAADPAAAAARLKVEIEAAR